MAVAGRTVDDVLRGRLRVYELRVVCVVFVDCRTRLTECVCLPVGECNWTEHERRLVAWAFNKWKRYQFTSLRVRFD